MKKDNKELEYELIATRERQRLYKYNGMISKTSEGIDIKDVEWSRLDPEINVISEVEYVVVSDAHTHLERMAFAVDDVNCVDNEAVKTIFEEEGISSSNRRYLGYIKSDRPILETNYFQIGGNMSMMTYGFGGINIGLLMSDEEILESIIAANE